MLHLALAVLGWFTFNTLLGLAIALAGGARPNRWAWPWIWRVREGSWLDGFFEHGWAFGITAQTFGLLVIFAPAADRDQLLAEERVHVVQQLLLGPAFWVVYAVQFLIAYVRLRDVSAAYRAIGLELAAHPRYGKGP